METILRIGAEGGSKALHAEKDSNNEWMFFIESDENAMADFLDDEDQDLVPLLNRKQRINSKNINQALEQLGPYWRKFYPIEVHPEFALIIYKNLILNPPHNLDHWKRLCLFINPLYRLASWMKDSQYTVVLSGAGMSTESGLPDFRSEDGWWRKIDPLKVANVETLEENYDLFREFYTYRIETVQQYAPHEGHYILAKWEREGRLQGLATQNVDGYHAAAGSKAVSELHGTIRSIRCHHCKKEAELDLFLNGSKCTLCHGSLRPNVVLFGESLPHGAWQQAASWFREAELVIVIGTSLQVAPASQLPNFTKGRTAYLNLDAPAEQSGFDLVISGKARGLLVELDEILSRI
jgi:NAD-dependent deacetylase